MLEVTTSRLLLLLAATLPPAALLAWLSGFAVRRYAPRWGLVDRPNNGHKAHAAPTPLGGGLALWCGMLLPLAAGAGLLSAFAEPPAWLPAWIIPHWPGLRERLPQLAALFGGATALLAVGLIDDRRGLPWQVKLAAQALVAAACLWATGWKLTLFLPLPWLGFALSVLWIVAIVNAFNMLDNMDGLAAGVGMIASLALAAALLLGRGGELRPQWFVAGLLLLLAGSLLGFLLHNRPPAKLFLGDAGSYFLGFLLAVAALLGTYADYSAARPHAVLTPLCLLAVPLYDLLSVVCIRLSRGRSPFQPDRNHFSHRLVQLGFSRPAAVGMVWLVAFICGLAALLLPALEPWRAALLGLMLLALLLFIALLEAVARRREG